MNSTSESALSLRAAASSDAARVLGWQQAAGVREHFRIQRPPEASEHARWFSNRLDQDEPFFWLIERGDTQAGFIRLDPVKNEFDTFEVAIVIAPELQGEGIGSWAISQLRSRFPHFTLLADVEPENEASRRAFEKAGFLSKSGRMMISKSSVNDVNE
jgi:RimJ/RimL family protein N-acetyltransferase